MKNENVAKHVNTEYFRLLKDDLVIDPCDGTDIISGSNDMSQAGTDYDFVRWSANESGQPTGETLVNVSEIINDENFGGIFYSLGGIEKLCLTQHQIKKFIKKNRQWLKPDNFGTLFPFESYSQFFFAAVHMRSNGWLGAYLLRFEDWDFWSAYRRPRFVFKL